MLITSVICWIVVRPSCPDAGARNLAVVAHGLPRLVLGLSLMIFYLNVDIGVYGTMWIMFSSRSHALHAVRPALQHHVDCCRSQGARESPPQRCVVVTTSGA